MLAFLPKKRGKEDQGDQAKVPPHNGNDPPPAPSSLKALLFPPLLNNVENKGTQGVRARCGAELPPFISIAGHGTNHFCPFTGEGFTDLLFIYRVLSAA